MAKVTGPLMSKTAAGRIKGRLVFSLRASGQQVRFQRSQADLVSDGRTAQRNFYIEAVGAWNSLTDEEQESYKEQAKELDMTGYNLYIQGYLDYGPEYQEKGIYGQGIYGVAIYGNS